MKAALAHRDAGLAGQPAVHVGHDGGEALLADEHGPDGALVVVKGVEDLAGAVLLGMPKTNSIPASSSTRTIASGTLTGWSRSLRTLMAALLPKIEVSLRHVPLRGR